MINIASPVGRLATLLLLAAAGCGGQGTGSDDTRQASTTLDAAFAERADAACRPYKTYDRAHSFSAKGFNRFDPDPKDLPAIGDFLDANPRHRTLVSDLQALGEPKTGAAAWKAVKDDIIAGEDLAKKQISSARRADAAGFSRLEQDIEDNNVTLHVDLRTLGLPPDSACIEAQVNQLLNRSGE